MVTIADLAIVGGCFGQAPTGSCANADVDGNGSIDNADLDIVAANIGNMFPTRTATPTPTATHTATSTPTLTPDV